MYTFSQWLNEQGYVGVVSGNPFVNGILQQAGGARSKTTAVESLPKLTYSNSECLYLGTNCKGKKYHKFRKGNF
jgi:hypothetical protein